MRRLIPASLLLLAACGGTADGDTTVSAVGTTALPQTTVPVTAAPPATTSAPPPTTLPPEVEEGLVTVEVTVTAGNVEGGGRVEVPLGDRVRLTVAADVSDEVHVHGYDLVAAVAPGASAVLEFVADIPGIFEVELHRAHSLLLDLEVAP